METTQTNAIAPGTTKEVVIGTMSIALTKAQLGVQILADMEAKLVYNEDNLKEIASFLELARKADKIVGDEHKRIKEPILRQSQVIDESKRELQEQLRSIAERANEKYAEMCQNIEKRKREAEEERQRKLAINIGIDNNMISFSGKIAACKTNTELLEIERLINLEKGKKYKYAEFFEDAVAKYNTLTTLLTAQKASIREFDKLEKQRLEAEKKGDDEKLIAIQEQQFTLEAKIDEAKVTVQETAINQSVNQVIEVTEQLPSVKTRRAMWTWEVSDIQKTVKSMPSWTRVETVDEKIDEFLKASKEQWAGKEEMIVNGIRFYLKKTY